MRIIHINIFIYILFKLRGYDRRNSVIERIELGQENQIVDCSVSHKKKGTFNSHFRIDWKKFMCYKKNSLTTRNFWCSECNNVSSHTPNYSGLSTENILCDLFYCSIHRRKLKISFYLNKYMKEKRKL